MSQYKTNPDLIEDELCAIHYRNKPVLVTTAFIMPGMCGDTKEVIEAQKQYKQIHYADLRDRFVSNQEHFLRYMTGNLTDTRTEEREVCAVMHNEMDALARPDTKTFRLTI